MRGKRMKVLRMLGIAVIALLAWHQLADAQRLTPIPRRGGRTRARTSPGSPWTPLTNQPIFLDLFNCAGAANPLLLTDGTVMVQEGGCQHWWRLTPDDTGSYVNGMWSQLASLPSNYSPLYHSSAVLPDGRVIIEGGEYNFFNPVWTNLGAIYDPLANTWTSVSPPSFFGGFGPFPQTIGDAQSIVLANGQYLQADCCTKQEALLDPKTLTWTATGAGKFDIHDEEGWTLLPNKHVLTVDAYVGQYNPTGTNSEIYVPASGKWHSAGSTVVQLWDSAANCGGSKAASSEVGPAVLRPDGTVFYTGANGCGAGHTAIYNSNTENQTDGPENSNMGNWTAGPDFPNALDIADGPASLLPNGNVLLDTSPGIFNPPTSFFEFDGANLNPVPGPPNAPGDISFYGNMLILPTGQVLFTDFSDDIEIYTAAGTYNPAWAPRIKESPDTVRPGGSYVISGHRFNGLSQGAAYGDDVQAATNYPLVRITNRTTGHVFYSRTHDHSSMAVAFRGIVSTHFDVPANQELGVSDLVVVANGIPSRSVTVNVR
jgi:hypothetical protein